jgi:hypothetical protein
VGNRKSHAKDNVLATRDFRGLPSCRQTRCRDFTRCQCTYWFSRSKKQPPKHQRTNEDGAKFEKPKTSESRVKNTTCHCILLHFPVEWKKLEKRNGKHPPPFLWFWQLLKKSLNIQSNRKEPNTHTYMVVVSEEKAESGKRVDNLRPNKKKQQLTREFSTHQWRWLAQVVMLRYIHQTTPAG